MEIFRMFGTAARSLGPDAAGCSAAFYLASEMALGWGGL